MVIRSSPVTADVPRQRQCRMTTQRQSNAFGRLASIFLLTVVVVLVLPFAIATLIAMAIYGVGLSVVVWLTWCTRGIDTLVVYSDSPNWHDYMVESVIPRLHGRSVVINWSERRSWKWHSLSVAVFRFFGGNREFNPMVVVLRPFAIPRTFRFWQSFRDRKHGNASSIHDVERRLYTYLDISPAQTDG